MYRQKKKKKKKTVDRCVQKLPTVLSSFFWEEQIYT